MQPGPSSTPPASVPSSPGVEAAPRAIPVSECLLRREAVENAVADLRLEGLAPTADAQLLFEQFVQGDLTEEQLVNAVLAR
ncbi:MAG: antitoxin VbhA family protein [Candidatus Korobacteraceae bacterium]